MEIRNICNQGLSWVPFSDIYRQYHSFLCLSLYSIQYRCPFQIEFYRKGGINANLTTCLCSPVAVLQTTTVNCVSYQLSEIVFVLCDACLSVNVSVWWSPPPSLVDDITTKGLLPCCCSCSASITVSYTIPFTTNGIRKSVVGPFCYTTTNRGECGGGNKDSSRLYP